MLVTSHGLMCLVFSEAAADLSLSLSLSLGEDRDGLDIIPWPRPFHLGACGASWPMLSMTYVGQMSSSLQSFSDEMPVRTSRL